MVEQSGQLGPSKLLPNVETVRIVVVKDLTHLHHGVVSVRERFAIG